MSARTTWMRNMVAAMLLSSLVAIQPTHSAQATVLIRQPEDPQFTLRGLHIAVWLEQDGSGQVIIEGAIGPTKSDVGKVQIVWPYSSLDIDSESVKAILPYLPDAIREQRPVLRVFPVPYEEGFRRINFTMIEIQFPRSLPRNSNGEYYGDFGVRFVQNHIAERVPGLPGPLSCLSERWRVTLYMYYEWLSYEFWSVTRDRIRIPLQEGSYKVIDIMLPKDFTFDRIHPATAQVDRYYVWKTPHERDVNDTLMRIMLRDESSMAETVEISLSLMVEYRRAVWWQEPQPAGMAILTAAIFFVLGFLVQHKRQRRERQPS